MKKIALFAFNGEFMCFIHVLLNGLHLKQNGEEVKIVVEGSATKLIPELSKEGNPMFQLYQQAKEQNLIDGVCRACSAKMEVTSAVEKEGLPFLDEMSGHPSMTRYLNNGYEIISF
ncbi:MAG: hypothetical protein PVJ11_14125 [Syntrophobacterales bacterium]|jgi:hypothetical protein